MHIYQFEINRPATINEILLHIYCWKLKICEIYKGGSFILNTNILAHDCNSYKKTEFSQYLQILNLDCSHNCLHWYAKDIKFKTTWLK